MVLSSQECHICMVLLLLVTVTVAVGESLTCLAVYREGGAPAVFQSPKCPLWNVRSHDYGHSMPYPASDGCQVAVIQGRRKSQEDRAICRLGIRIPFFDEKGVKEVNVGIAAVFDGHNGGEASEMASNLLLDYFALHTYFLLDTAYSLFLRSERKYSTIGVNDIISLAQNQQGLYQHDSSYESPENTGEAFYLSILKEALLRALKDIDAKFTKEAFWHSYDSGSTATVMILADDQVLVANIGDSRAMICSSKNLSSIEARGLYRKRRCNILNSRSKCKNKCLASSGLEHLVVRELTEDHHPDRMDERMRIDSAGGHVLSSNGVSRVNGQLAVSRAIGDVRLKRFGVISVPEVRNWQPFTRNDSYMVVASDGMFEKLDVQDVCNILQEGNIMENSTQNSPNFFAQLLVNAAFERGSMDNIAVVLVSLPRWSESYQKHQMGPHNRTRNLYFSSENEVINYNLGFAHPHTTILGRLLVGRIHGDTRLFYLSENLKADIHTFLVFHGQENCSYSVPQPLHKTISINDGMLDLYNVQNSCLFSGTPAERSNHQCAVPDMFTSFFALIESIPFQDPADHGSSEFIVPELRYILKKKFDRGSYGEVWLAFHLDNDNLKGRKEVEGYMFDANFTFNKQYSGFNFSQFNDFDRLRDKYVLKRIAVEKGNAAYLSGLREKHFGEVFLNASATLCGSTLAKFASGFAYNSKMNSLHWSPNTLSCGRLEEGLNHIARYVESFQSLFSEIWLVFRHEGISMSKLLYVTEDADGDLGEKGQEAGKFLMLRPSNWWHWLKITEAGKNEMRNIIWQLLLALKACHDRNITHRDIKPENMVICFEDLETGICSERDPSDAMKHSLKMRIIDFGSAIDEYSKRHFYGSTGPSRAEQTSEYTPPEALLNASWHLSPTSTVLKYDMWSVAVVFLELILGTPNVFQISAVTRSLLDQHVCGWNSDLKELAYKLRSFMELCILVPGESFERHADAEGGIPLASWKCSEEFFSEQIKKRDPLNLGFPNVWALRLVRQLLLWEPADRLTVDDALQHPYFHRS